MDYPFVGLLSLLNALSVWLRHQKTETKKSSLLFQASVLINNNGQGYERNSDLSPWIGS